MSQNTWHVGVIRCCALPFYSKYNAKSDWLYTSQFTVAISERHKPLWNEVQIATGKFLCSNS